MTQKIKKNEYTAEQLLRQINICTIDSKVSRAIMEDREGLLGIAKIILKYQVINFNIEFDKEKDLFVVEVL